MILSISWHKNYPTSLPPILNKTRSVLRKASAGERPRRRKTKRPEPALFERSEFADDSVVFRRSSEAGAALIFWLLFYQEKSKIMTC